MGLFGHLSDAREPEDHKLVSNKKASTNEQPSAKRVNGAETAAQRAREMEMAAEEAEKQAANEAIEKGLADTANEVKPVTKKKKVSKGSIRWADESPPVSTADNSLPSPSSGLSRTFTPTSLTVASGPLTRSLTEIRLFYRDLPPSSYGQLSAKELAEARQAMAMEVEKAETTLTVNSNENRSVVRRFVTTFGAHRSTANVPHITCDTLIGWRAPVEIATNPEFLLGRGSQSKERDIQISRERQSMARLYIDSKQIPPEPELVPQDEPNANDGPDNSAPTIKRIPFDADIPQSDSPSPPPPTPALSFEALSTLNALKGLLSSVTSASSSASGSTSSGPSSTASTPTGSTSLGLQSILAKARAAAAASSSTTASTPPSTTVPTVTPTSYFPPQSTAPLSTPTTNSSLPMPTSLPVPPSSSATPSVNPPPIGTYFSNYAQSNSGAPPTSHFPPPPPPTSQSSTVPSSTMNYNSFPPPPAPSSTPAVSASTSSFPPPPSSSSSTPLNPSASAPSSLPPPNWPSHLPYNSHVAAQTQMQIHQPPQPSQPLPSQHNLPSQPFQSNSQPSHDSILASRKRSAPDDTHEPKRLRTEAVSNLPYSYMQDVRSVPSANGLNPLANKPWLNGPRTFTKLCSWFGGSIGCTSGDNCKFAHVLKHNRIPPDQHEAKVRAEMLAKGNQYSNMNGMGAGNTNGNATSHGPTYSQPTSTTVSYAPNTSYAHVNPQTPAHSNTSYQQPSAPSQYSTQQQPNPPYQQQPSYPPQPNPSMVQNYSNPPQSTHYSAPTSGQYSAPNQYSQPPATSQYSQPTHSQSMPMPVSVSSQPQPKPVHVSRFSPPHSHQQSMPQPTYNNNPSTQPLPTANPFPSQTSQAGGYSFPTPQPTNPPQPQSSQFPQQSAYPPTYRPPNSTGQQTFLPPPPVGHSSYSNSNPNPSQSPAGNYWPANTPQAQPNQSTPSYQQPIHQHQQYQQQPNQYQTAPQNYGYRA